MIKITDNILEEIWIDGSKPNLKRQLFGTRVPDHWDKVIDHKNLKEYCYACYFRTKKEVPRKIIGWEGATRKLYRIGECSKFKNFIQDKLPSNRKKLAYHLDLFSLCYNPTSNNLNLFTPKDNKKLIVDDMFKATNGIIIWHHQIEELFQYVGFNKREALKLRKDYQKNLKSAYQKLGKIEVNSHKLTDILAWRIPPKKTCQLHLDKSEEFYKILSNRF